jgi:parvulin-like peptidyl-prolyl isomerase
LDRLALRRLINRRLLLQEAGLKGITVPEKELDKAIAALRRSFEDLGSFGVWMKQQDLDEQSLFGSVHADMLAARVSAALVEDVRVTAKQVQQYYESHKDDLKADDVRLQIIVVKDKVTAEKVLTALREGRDFASLARQMSIGRRAAKGGDTGWVSSETLWPPLQKFVGAMKAGEAGGSLQKGNEFLIVRLEARRPGRTKTLAEAGPQIEPRLLAAKRQEVVQDWLAAREKEAKIEVLLRPDPR